MDRSCARAIPHLRAARESWRNDDRPTLDGRVHIGEELHASDLHRQLVMLAFVPERSGHPAAPGGGFPNLGARASQHVQDRLGQKAEFFSPLAD